MVVVDQFVSDRIVRTILLWLSRQFFTLLLADLLENHNIIATYDPSIAIKAYFCVTSVHVRMANACSAYATAITTIMLA